MNWPRFLVFGDTLRCRNGVAALEFAICAPALLVVLGGLADFGLAFGDSAQIEQAAEAGATYAFAAQQEAGVNGTISASTVKAVVQASLALSPSPTVTVTGPEPECTQSNGGTTTLTSGTYGQPCPNGDTVGTYVVISVQYTYQPLLPSYSTMASTNLSATSIVRLY